MEWLTVERKTLPIVLRSVGILMNSVVHGGLYQLYLTAQRDNQNFKLAYIPEDFQMESREFFDMDYINALFNVGYESAKSGQEWSNAPPDYETTQ